MLYFPDSYPFIIEAGVRRQAPSVELMQRVGMPPAGYRIVLSGVLQAGDIMGCVYVGWSAPVSASCASLGRSISDFFLIARRCDL